MWETLAAAVGLWRGRCVLESSALLRGGDGWVGLQALGHFVTDDVHKALEGLLHVHVILGAGFKKLKPWRKHRNSSVTARFWSSADSVTVFECGGDEGRCGLDGDGNSMCSATHWP